MCRATEVAAVPSVERRTPVAELLLGKSNHFIEPRGVLVAPYRISGRRSLWTCVRTPRLRSSPTSELRFRTALNRR